MTEKKFMIKDRIRSLGFAFNGFRILIREEHNAIVHLIIASIVLFLGFLFDISSINCVFAALREIKIQILFSIFIYF